MKTNAIFYSEILQVHNPLYLSLQPANTQMARGLVSLLAVNYWYRVTMLVEEQLRHDGFRDTFHHLTVESKWIVEDELFFSQDMTHQTVRSVLSGLNPNVSRIFVMHTSVALARRIIAMASTVLATDRQFAWIITGNAYTQDESILKSFSLGTKAFLTSQEIRPDDMLKDSLDLLLTAFQGNNFSPSKGEQKRFPQKGCWSTNGASHTSHDNIVYK